ncbi:MAG: zf-HC2 domain-containing protein [Burkholderiaceae bacterium]|nr:zf-HC2 domain-containing protein [Burkholderiaceae bacterium]
MAGRVLSFFKSPHQGVQELLPWFLNGSLEADEAAGVEKHLQSCPSCREELQCLRAIRDEYLETESVPQAEAALARLRPRLDETASALPPLRRAGGRSTPSSAAASRSRRGLAVQLPIPDWVKFALAAQFVLIFALGWVVLQPMKMDSPYRALANPGGLDRPVGSAVVVFDPNAPQREVTRILRASGGRVVDGPTVSNGYVLAVPGPELDTALARLRAEPTVVLAEPLQLERPR